jgi:23S rRNA G2069 N7-methylase RlmK/C1962 C5-methylase RlmI
VVSVDLSAKFLDWAKENFVANQLDPASKNTDASPRFEFRAIETRAYLAWAKKQGLRFDLMICDPPSFARTDKGVFRIETDFEALLIECVSLLAPGGRLLVCSNFEGWTVPQWWQQLQRLLPKLQSHYLTQSRALKAREEARLKLRLQNPTSPDWDFEFPREERAMKCAVIEVIAES